MLVSEKLNAKLNEQVTNELFASQTYLAMSSMFKREGLHLLAGLFRKQAEEEREHALKILGYIEDRLGKVALAAVPAPKGDYPSVLAALEAAVEHEKLVSRQIDALVELAEEEKDQATQAFLGWFVEEQIEEVHSMHKLAQAAKMAGPALLQIEAYLIHIKG